MTRDLKLLFFAMRFQPEQVGTARYVVTLAEGLSKSGIQVTVLAPAYARHHPEDELLPYQVYRIPGGHHAFVPMRYPLARTALRRTLERVRPDVLWAANGMATRVAGTLVDELKGPVVGSIHGTDIATRLPGRSPRTWIESIPQRRFYERSDHLATNSRFTRDLALRKGIDSGKLRVVYLGVDLPEDPTPVRRRARKRHPELACRPIVLSVARLIKQKGHKLLIEAMNQVVAMRPEALLIIVGDGPERPALAAQIRRCRREKNILLTGGVSQERLEEYYALARVFALTSQPVQSCVEGLGFVFIEAARWRVPSVGTNHGGIPEVILHGETGFLADPGQPQEIARHIARLLEDEALCTGMGDGARQRVKTYFSKDRMVDAGKEILVRAVGC